MKKILFLLFLSPFTFHLSPSLAQHTYTQQVPDLVNEIRLEGNVRLIVKSTTGEMALQTITQAKVASLKNSRLTIAGSQYDVTLLLPEGHQMTFNVEDNAYLLFMGSFGKRQFLSVHTEDNSSATFSGTDSDSLWAVTLNLKAEDNSSITSEISLHCFNLNLDADDFSRIQLSHCIKTVNEPNLTSRTQSAYRSDNAHLEFSHCDLDSIALLTYGKHYTPKADDDKAKSIWRHRDVALNFAWGFHNWGSSQFNGFAGVDGPAAIRTSFNNIQLSVDYPFIGTRHFALYVGLGLEWDKYKFEAKDITFNTAVNPHGFSDGGDPSCTSWLNTRYVVLPLTLRFDLWHDWSLTLTALPGIHWSGSHTGLRRHYSTDLEDRTDYDCSINKHINPYKLDLRATLKYDLFGLYFQVPTMSTFRSSVQELYPIKFGLSFTID